MGQYDNCSLGVNRPFSFLVSSPAWFATEVRRRVVGEQRAGAVVSFPTIHVFSPEQLEAASRFGISTVVLWGPKEQCIKARRERSEKRGVRFYVARYEKKNRPSSEAYARSEYSEYRIEVFCAGWPTLAT